MGAADVSVPRRGGRAFPANDECRGTRVPRANRVEPARTVHSFGDEDNGPRESSRRTKNTGRGSEIKVELDASDFDVGFGLGQGSRNPAVSRNRRETRRAFVSLIYPL